MPFETYIAYVLTVLIFMLAPGPSHLLMLSTSMAEGAQRSLFTAVGDLSANVLQIVLVSLGIAYLFNLQSGVVEVFQYMGVVYLAWVGVNLFRTAYKDKPGVGIASPTSGFTLWLRGFVTSASNPKALVFFCFALSTIYFYRQSDRTASADSRRQLHCYRWCVFGKLRFWRLAIDEISR